jgi:hypothetical protein
MRAGIDAVSSSPRLVFPTDDRGPNPRRRNPGDPAGEPAFSLDRRWLGDFVDVARIEEMVCAGRRAVIRRQAGLCG